MKKLLSLTLLCTAIFFCFLSCSKDEDTPAVKSIQISVSSGNRLYTNY